jgi:lysophospholipase L1-like esterase
MLRRVTRRGAHVVIATQPPPVAGLFITLNDDEMAAQQEAFARLNVQLLKFAGRHPDDVTLVDLAGKVCPGDPPCPLRVDGIKVRPLDGGHFSPQAAVWLSKWLLPTLEAADRSPASSRTVGP